MMLIKDSCISVLDPQEVPKRVLGIFVFVTMLN